jgi:2-polyprenyl-3-methyl-5-hydroxy-6-metoxy-1,4-benzoquinol methylase
MKILDQRSEWQRIWQQKGFLASLVSWGRQIYNRYFLEFFLPRISHDTRFLELGSGTSSLLVSLAPHMKEAVGMDIAETSITLSTQAADAARVTNARFILADCLTAEPDPSYDIVWSQGLMEHFDNPRAIAEAHFKFLKPGGTALISIPYRYSYHAIWYLLTRPMFLRRFWPWTDQQFLTKQTLRIIGKSITPNTKVYLLKPPFLGLAILELRK